MAILLKGQAHSLGPLLAPHHRMYSRGQLGFLFPGESFEVWLTQSLFFFLDVTTLKYSVSKQTDGQTSKDTALKGSISLTMALKGQTASFRI